MSVTAGAESATRRDVRGMGRGSLLSLIGSGVSAVANVAVVLIVARVAGQRGAGLFFSATSLFLMLESLCRLGTPTGLVYFIARHRELGEDGTVPALWRAARVPVLILSLVCAIAVFVLAAPLSGVLTRSGAEDLAPLLRVLAPVIPVVTLYDAALAGTRGYGKMQPTTLVERVGRPLAQVAGLLALAPTRNIVLLALAWVLPYLPALLLGRRTLRRLLRSSAGGGSGAVSSVTGPFWRFSAARAVAAVASIGLQRLDVILLAALRGPADAAVYTAATRFLVLGQIVNQAVIWPLQPRLSAALARGDRARAKTLYQTSTCWLVLLTWPVFLVMATAASWVLRLFGKDYQHGAPVTVLLALIMLVAMASGMVDTVLNMAGRSTWNLANTLAALAVNVVVDLLLIPRLGIIGAAIGWAAAILVNNLVPLAQIWVLLGLHPFGRGTLEALALATCCFALPTAAASVLAAGSSAWLAAAVAGGGLVYLVGLRLRRRTFQLDALLSSARRRERAQDQAAHRGGGA